MKYKSVKKRNITRRNKKNRTIKSKNKQSGGNNSDSALMLCHDYSKHKKYIFANKLGDNFYAEDIFSVVDYVDPKANSAILPKGEQFKSLDNIPAAKSYDKIFSLFCPIYDCLLAANVKNVNEGKISFQEALKGCRLNLFQKVISSAVNLLSENGLLFIPIVKKVGPKNRVHVTDIDSDDK